MSEFKRRLFEIKKRFGIPEAKTIGLMGISKSYAHRLLNGERNLSKNMETALNEIEENLFRKHYYFEIAGRVGHDISQGDLYDEAKKLLMKDFDKNYHEIVRNFNNINLR